MRKFTAAITIVLSTITVSCGGSSSKAGDTSSGSDAPASETEFCTAFTDFQSAAKKIGEGLASADSDVQAAVEAEKAIKGVSKIVAKLADKMISNAPEELKNDARLVATALVDTFDLLASIDYDVTKLMDDQDLARKFDQIYSDPAMEDAGAAVDAYVSDKCGIDFNDSSSAAGTAFCVSAQQAVVTQSGINSMQESVISDRAEAVRNLAGSVVGLTDQMLETAPDEMRDDVKIMSDHAKEILALLDGLDFDIDKALSDPEYMSLDSDSANAAAVQNIRDYCGITMEES